MLLLNVAYNEFALSAFELESDVVAVLVPVKKAFGSRRPLEQSFAFSHHFSKFVCESRQ